MSGSFAVVYADLGTASSAFENESTQFLTVSRQLAGATAADTGDADLTELVGRILQVGDFLADDLRNATFGHASKLGMCSQSYQRSDTHSSALFTALMTS